MWKNWNLCALWLEMSNSTATVGNGADLLK